MADEPDARAVRATLDRLHAATGRGRAAIAEIEGLGPSDWAACELLVDRGRATPTELSRELRLSTGGTTTVVDRLVASRRAVRTVGPGGRRRVLVEPTDLAVRSVLAWRQRAEAELRGALAQLPLAERSAVMRVLAALSAVTDAATERLVMEAASSGPAGPGAPVVVEWG